jgi:hypothetical protein
VVTFFFFLLYRSFSVWGSPSVNFSLNCWAIGVLFKKLWLMSICASVFLVLSCSSFKVLGFRTYIESFDPLWLDIQFRWNIQAATQFSRHHLVWETCYFNKYFGILCQKSFGYKCVDLCLDILFCSIYLHVCFCASTVVFLFLWLCSIVWSQVMWYLHGCSLCSVLLCLFDIFCTGKHFWTS